MGGVRFELSKNGRKRALSAVSQIALGSSPTILGHLLEYAVGEGTLI